MTCIDISIFPDSFLPFFLIIFQLYAYRHYLSLVLSLSRSLSPSISRYLALWSDIDTLSHTHTHTAQEFELLIKSWKRENGRSSSSKILAWQRQSEEKEYQMAYKTVDIKGISLPLSKASLLVAWVDATDDIDVDVKVLHGHVEDVYSWYETLCHISFFCVCQLCFSIELARVGWKSEPRLESRERESKTWLVPLHFTERLVNLAREKETVSDSLVDWSWWTLLAIAI